MIKIGMDARTNSHFDEATPSFSIPDPPTSAFFGQLLFASGEVHILHSYLPEAIGIRGHPFVVNGVKRNVSP